MIELAAALVVLIITPLVPSAPGVRPACIRLLGLIGFRVVYSIVSLTVVAWLIIAYIDAADGPWLWTPPHWGRWVAVFAMPVALWLIAARLMQRPGKMRTGVYRMIAAPGSCGLLLWSCLHLLNVGHARAVLLFGAFAVISAIAMIKNTQAAPPTAAPGGNGTVRHLKPMIAAVGAWALLLALHPFVIGVDPLVRILP